MHDAKEEGGGGKKERERVGGRVGGAEGKRMEKQGDAVAEGGSVVDGEP